MHLHGPFLMNERSSAVACGACSRVVGARCPACDGTGWLATPYWTRCRECNGWKFMKIPELW